MKKSVLHSTSRLSRELLRRRVYPVIATYAVISWLALQIAEVTFDPLGLPDWVMTALVVLVIAGFPVVLVLAWVFDIKLTAPLDFVEPDTESADDLPSVAVLPFADMSPGQDQGYFCDGIAEEILNALTRIPGLHVAARMSSFQYHEPAGDVREIGRALGVRAVLEGSVRKSGNLLRVTVQLVKVANGYHLWSKEFNQELRDIFSIQNEIATGVAEAMLDNLAPVSAIPNTDVTAYDYYLRGRHFFNRFTRLDMQHARGLFRKAIDIAPEFAAAWAGYADCHSFLIMYSDPRDSYRSEAYNAARMALSLDQTSAQAHASCGLAFLVSEDFDQAELHLERALELNPDLYEAYYFYGRTRFHQGDMEGAAELFRKAAEVNPADYQSRLLRVQILRGMGRVEEALEEARVGVAVVEKHLEWNPDDARALHLGAGSLALVGDRERAERWLQRAIEIDPNDSVVLYNVACNYATMGQADKALDYLEQAVANGMVSASWMRNDEDLASLHGQSRYELILARLDEGGPRSPALSHTGD